MRVFGSMPFRQCAGRDLNPQLRVVGIATRCSVRLSYRRALFLRVFVAFSCERREIAQPPSELNARRQASWKFCVGFFFSHVWTTPRSTHFTWPSTYRTCGPFL